MKFYSLIQLYIVDAQGSTKTVAFAHFITVSLSFGMWYVVWVLSKKVLCTHSSCSTLVGDVCTA